MVAVQSEQPHLNVIVPSGLISPLTTQPQLPLQLTVISPLTNWLVTPPRLTTSFLRCTQFLGTEHRQNYQQPLFSFYTKQWQQSQF